MCLLPSIGSGVLDLLSVCTTFFGLPVAWTRASAGRIWAAYVLPRTTLRSNIMFDARLAASSLSRYCKRKGMQRISYREKERKIQQRKRRRRQRLLSALIVICGILCFFFFFFLPLFSCASAQAVAPPRRHMFLLLRPSWHCKSRRRKISSRQRNVSFRKQRQWPQLVRSTERFFFVRSKDKRTFPVKCVYKMSAVFFIFFPSFSNSKSKHLSSVFDFCFTFIPRILVKQ